MKFPTDSWDFLLLMMLLKRLDHGIVTRFELEHGSSSIPKYLDSTDFLEKHCLALDTIDVSPSFGQVKRTNYIINSADYTLLTVVYGVSSLPYLALKVLLQLAEDEGKAYPLAAENIRHSSYVDDFVGGASTFEEARVLITELIALMKLGGFELRKWSSNEPSLLSDLPESYLSTNSSSFDNDHENTTLKVLGLHWNPSFDCFHFSFNPSADKSCTKRTMLSELAEIYDPLGFLTPVTFFTKYLIQRLWVSGIGWDENPTADIVRVWNQYKIESPDLSNLRIELFLPDSVRHELHGFCDASEKGYACVIYMRYVDMKNQISIQFVCGKSKVAPLRKITIPRLELCGAVLLAKL
ncbi:hypothetical protein JTB14_028637 [Gonioctena quinquepunctata]|nr:hypothetical protein JTB14_028637 [Gonioctena quinquepunctata]